MYTQRQTTTGVERKKSCGSRWAREAGRKRLVFKQGNTPARTADLIMLSGYLPLSGSYLLLVCWYCATAASASDRNGEIISDFRWVYYIEQQTALLCDSYKVIASLWCLKLKITLSNYVCAWLVKAQSDYWLPDHFTSL